MKPNVRFYSSSRFSCLAGVILVCATAGGCFQRQETVQTEYGKIRGRSGGSSLNSVSVLADMFRDSGHSVTRYGRLSPKIERYETLVWFPVDTDCPSDEAVARLEQWLLGGHRRTLIYVGYDSTAEVDYYQRLVEQAHGPQKERMMRELAEAQVAQDQQLYQDSSTNWRVRFVSGKPMDAKCRWFEKAAVRRMRSEELGGPLAGGIPSRERVAIETRLWLTPRESYLESRPGRQLETLLTVDERPFVFRFRDSEPVEGDYWSAQNQAIFVTNGSFLVNYGLVEPAHRRLAANLIAEIEPRSDVMFLESGQDGIVVSDSDYAEKNQWSWITKQPLCYMVPHFLAWGVLFCFAFFPIFGRPRQTTNERYRSFGDHIAAIARLSRRHTSLDDAKQKVQKLLDADDGGQLKKQSNVLNNSEKRKSR